MRKKKPEPWYDLPMLPRLKKTRKVVSTLVAPWDLTPAYLATLTEPARKELLGEYEEWLRSDLGAEDPSAGWRQDWLGRAIVFLRKKRGGSGLSVGGDQVKTIAGGSVIVPGSPAEPPSADGVTAQQTCPLVTEVTQTMAAQSANAGTIGNSPEAVVASWQDVEISFLSDERVQIREGTKSETCNYAELGFKDGRTGKPNKAWAMLLAMAAQDGVIRHAPKGPAGWPTLEKRIQEIRKRLRMHFTIAVDPIPYVKGTGYLAQFKICRGRSYHT